MSEAVDMRASVDQRRPTSRPAVSVVVPARNAESTLPSTLRALARQELDAPYEVLVVDDGSSDGTRAVAEGFSDITVLDGPGRGAGQARNAGARASRAPVLAFTDADCVPKADWLRRGLAEIAAADLVQGSVRPDPTVVRLPFDRTLSVTQETGLYELANVFVRRRLFDELGGFEDWLATGDGRPFGEDAWFGWRARRAGAQVTFSRETLVTHAVFRGSLSSFVGERARLRHFPALVRRVPELRRTLCWHRIFLSRRTAELDLLTVSLLLGFVSGRWIALAGALPYAVSSARSVVGWRRHAPRALAGEVLADAVGAAALAFGSLRQRALVL